MAHFTAVCLTRGFFVHHHIPRLRFPLRERERFFLSLWGRGISSAYYSADDATITTTEAALPRPPTRIVATLKVAKHQTSHLHVFIDARALDSA